MATPRVFGLSHDEARRRARQAIDQAPADHFVKILQASRTLEQNAAQWPILQALSEQSKWMVNGAEVLMSPDDWKDLLTAAFENEVVRVALGWNGGFVMLGSRTSEFGKKKFGEWLEFLNMVAAVRGVNLEKVEKK
jgi:hypothetical protein